MKMLLIVESEHLGNTLKVAKAMVEAVPEAELTDTAHAGEYDLSDYDLLGFGSGIYAGRHAVSIVKFAESIGKEPHSVFVFSTSADGKTSHNKPLIDLFKSKGKTVVGNFACRGLNKFLFLRWFGGMNKGHPNEGDLQNAREFIRSLKI